MFDEYGCGCVVSPVQGRVRVCPGHRNVLEYTGEKWTVLRFEPSGRVVRSYPANGEMPDGWNGR